MIAPNPIPQRGDFRGKREKKSIRILEGKNIQIIAISLARTVIAFVLSNRLARMIIEVAEKHARSIGKTSLSCLRDLQDSQVN